VLKVKFGNATNGQLRDLLRGSALQIPTQAEWHQHRDGRKGWACAIAVGENRGWRQRSGQMDERTYEST
jgi:hypothetical protein